MNLVEILHTENILNLSFERQYPIHILAKLWGDQYGTHLTKKIIFVLYQNNLYSSERRRLFQNIK